MWAPIFLAKSSFLSWFSIKWQEGGGSWSRLPVAHLTRATAVGNGRQGALLPGSGHGPMREAVAGAELGVAGGLPAVPPGPMGGFPRAGVDLGAKTHPKAEVGVGVMEGRRDLLRGLHEAGAFPRPAGSPLGVEGSFPPPCATEFCLICLPTTALFVSGSVSVAETRCKN